MNQLMKATILAGASAAGLVYESVKQRVAILYQIASRRDEYFVIEPERDAPATDPAAARQRQRLAG